MNTQPVILKDYPFYQEVEDFPTATTKDEEYYDLVNQQIQYLFVNRYFSKKPRIFPHVLCLKEIDFSSVNPKFEECDTISWIDTTGESVSFEEMIEYDEVFRLPPKNSYNIKMTIKSIEKPKPKFIEPY